MRGKTATAPQWLQVEFKGLARQIAQMQGHAAPSFDVLEDTLTQSTMYECWFSRPSAMTKLSMKEIFDEFDKDFTGKMGMDEFNWAYATLQLKVKEAC